MPRSGSGFQDTLAKLKDKVADAIVQDCPPEIEACEVCRRLLCTNEAWIHCETRQAALVHARSGDDAAIDALRRQTGPRVLTCVRDDSGAATA